jgi:hypothetical protein
VVRENGQREETAAPARSPLMLLIQCRGSSLRFEANNRCFRATVVTSDHSGAFQLVVFLIKQCFHTVTKVLKMPLERSLEGL